jgi:hypothetical protein
MSDTAASATITANPGDVWGCDVDLALWEEFEGDQDISDKFAAAGFINVTCTGSGSTRYVQGTWPGPAKTIALSDMDPHLANWRKLSP